MPNNSVLSNSMLNQANLKKPQLIKDGSVIDDSWLLLNKTETPATVDVPAGNVIVSLEILQSQTDLKKRRDIGVLLTNDVDLDSIAESLLTLPVIAIDFPVFMDGRGFSLARLLRDRYGYQGEIRAVGHVIRDQLCYLKRCGFNAFSFNDEVDLDAALDSLNDFREAYQTSADQPLPLFKRRG